MRTDLVVAEDRALAGAEPHLHRVEAGPGRAAEDLRAVGTVGAEAVAIAELREERGEPRIGGHARVHGLPRRRLRRGPQQAEQPADHPGTDCAFQICSAYSRMVRSEENFPIRATFRIAILVQRSLSTKACSTRCWQSAYEAKSASSR